MYRNPHNLRVVTLSSRESRGNVLYPPEFARLASAPIPGDVPDPHTMPRSRERRGVLWPELLLSIAIGCAIYGMLTVSPLWLACGFVACVAGCVL